MFNDTLLVSQTVAGCPAAKVGILPGDRIIYIGDKLIAGVKLPSWNSEKPSVLKDRKCQYESFVREISLLLFKIIRDKIPLYSVDATYMIGKDIGYIKSAALEAQR